MKNARLMCCRQPIGNPRKQVEYLLPGMALALNPITQSSAVDKLRDQVLAAVVFADVVNGDDMWMIQGGGHLRFPLKTPSGRRVRKVLRKELHGHCPLQ